ncbi:cobalamin-binding protein [Marinobacterium nitratireducens]|uniref:Cobalamin-binding protein n=1 Tax=Marinobacterium nitratireducens TaxID=518897 RepID=A0A917ZI31_9GAMM|nr:cobalamin-binding protein [Marinobacterium nitratireducens]GGO82912.1 cobalamin-binding protein [Marinobacterium nitratireducens]
MCKKYILIKCFVLLLSLPALAQIAVVDDSGRTIVLEAPAQRILALAPHVTENLFSIGAGDLVVGTVSYSDYPPEALAIPRIGNYERLSLEQALALEPDLAIAWPPGNDAVQLQRLRDFGIPVFESDPNSFATIAGELRRLGRLTGRDQAAGQVAKELEAGVEKLAVRHRNAPPLRVFYQLWHEPLMTVNGSQLVDRMLQLCGGVNPFAGRPEAAPGLGVEAVLAASPDVIVTTTEEAPANWRERWRRWPQLPAVQHDLFYQLEADWMHRATVRALYGAQQLCRDLDDARARLGLERAADPHQATEEGD